MRQLLSAKCLDDYQNETDDDRKLTRRNSLIADIMDQLDSGYSAFKEELRGQSVTSNLLSDWLHLGIGTATTLVGGEGTKTALGAAQTGILGARSAYGKNVFGQLTVDTLISRMDANREQIYTEIVRNRSLPDGVYNLWDALRDVRRYYHAGTIGGAIQGISEAAGADIVREASQLHTVRTEIFLADDAGDLLREWLYNDRETVREANLAALTSWLDNAGIPGGPTLFLRSESMAQARIKAVHDLLILDEEGEVP